MHDAFFSLVLRYQYVCVVATMGTVEEGIWHRRRAPVRWTRQPPFHVRIVRPNPAGMLDIMLAKGKIKLAKKVPYVVRVWSVGACLLFSVPVTCGWARARVCVCVA